MKLYSLTVAALALSTSLFAAAQTAVQSEYFYQAPVDSNVFTPAVDYTANTIKVKNVSNAQKEVGPTINLTYERGLTDAFSTGLTVGYLSGTTEAASATATTSKKETGLTDLDIFFKGESAFTEGSSLHYGVSLIAGLENHKIDSSGDANAATGAMFVAPYVGYQWAVGAGATGVSLSTELLKSAKTENAGTTSTVEDGNATRLAGFYEMKMDSTMIDFEGRYTTISDKKNKDANTTTEMPDYIGLAVVPTFTLSPSTTILGSLSYDKMLDTKLKDAGLEYEIENGDILAVNIAGRFTF